MCYICGIIRKCKAMKKIIFLCIFVLSVLVHTKVIAENYILLSIYKCDSIQIGNKYVKSGEVFSDTETIKWKDAAVAIKAQNKKNKKIVVFSQKQMANTMSSSLGDYLRQTHHLSTRSESEAKMIKEQLDGMLPLGKNIKIDLSITPDSKRWLAIRWKDDNGQDLVKRITLKKKGTQMVLGNLDGIANVTELFTAELIMGSGEFGENEEIIDKAIEVIPF